MRTANIALVIAALLSAAIALGAEEPVTLQLEANPTGVQVHVPIHLHTIMENHSHQPLVGEFSWLTGDRGFTFMVSRNGGQYYNFIENKEPDFDTAEPALVVHHYRDEQYLPGSEFVPGDSVQRHDPFVIQTPGEYRIKAVLKWPEEEPYYSNVVEVRVKEPETNSCLSKKLDDEELKSMGQCIYGAYYGERLFTREWWERKDILGMVDRIQANCPDNPYGAYLDYLDVMYFVLYDEPSLERLQGGVVTEPKDHGKLVVDFLEAHPDSWLMRDLAREAFWFDYNHHRENLDWAIDLVRPYLPRPGEPVDVKFIPIRNTLQEARPSALP